MLAREDLWCNPGLDVCCLVSTGARRLELVDHREAFIRSRHKRRISLPLFDVAPSDSLEPTVRSDLAPSESLCWELMQQLAQKVSALHTQHSATGNWQSLGRPVALLETSLDTLVGISGRSLRMLLNSSSCVAAWNGVDPAPDRHCDGQIWRCAATLHDLADNNSQRPIYHTTIRAQPSAARTQQHTESRCQCI